MKRSSEYLIVAIVFSIIYLYTFFIDLILEKKFIKAFIGPSAANILWLILTSIFWILYIKEKNENN